MIKFKAMIKTYATLIFIIFFNISLKSQNLDWVNIGAINSYSKLASVCLNNDILIVQGSEDGGNISKIDSIGQVIWSISINDNFDDEIIYSVELPSTNILHISKKGKLYTTNSMGENPFFTDSLSLNNGAIGNIRYASIADNKIELIGSGKIQGDGVYFESSIDVNTIEIETKIDAENDQLFRFDINRNFGLKAGLYDGFMIIRDLDGNTILDKELDVDHPLDRYRDLAIINENTIIVIGNKYTGGTSYEGFAKSIDIDGNVNWEEIYSPIGSNFTLELSSIARNENSRIVIGGFNGTGIQGSIFLSEINENGNILWDFQKSYSTDNDIIHDLIFNKNNNLIAIGTGGIVDVEAETFGIVMQVSGLINFVQSISKSIIKMFPNPSNSLVTIDINEGCCNSLKIYDLSGSLIKSKNDSCIFDVTSFASGMYLIVCEINGQNNMTKLLVK